MDHKGTHMDQAGMANTSRGKGITSRFAPVGKLGKGFTAGGVTVQAVSHPRPRAYSLFKRYPTPSSVTMCLGREGSSSIFCRRLLMLTRSTFCCSA